LSPEERVDELARMLGGVEITPRARAHANEMLAAVASAAAAASAIASSAASSTQASGGRRPARPRPAPPVK
jgi:ribosomal protein L12E/L44/L45/RPP1/RPP2